MQNHLVEVNSITWASVELNPGKVIKNTLIDVPARAACKKAGNLAKSAKLDKIAAKATVNGTNKASALVQKVTGVSSRAREVAKKD